MQKTTNDMSNPGNEDSAGLPNTKQVAARQLYPWEIAEKLFRTEKGRVVDVEHASDTQFQTWIAGQGIPMDEDGIPEWSFDDRCGVINHALAHGIQLHFFEATSEQEGA